MPSEERGKTELARHLQNMQCSVAEGDESEAMRSLVAMFQLIADHPDVIDIEPGPFEIADTLLENGDWSGVEAIYLQILANSSDDDVAVFRAHSYLAWLYKIVEKHEEALHHTQTAIATMGGFDLPLEHWVALKIQEGELYLDLNMPNEVMSIISAVTAFHEQLSQGSLASVHLLQAHSFLAVRQIEEVERELAAALAIWTPMSEAPLAAGVHSSLSDCWAATARLRTVVGDRDRAVTAWEEAVAASRRVLSFPHAQCAVTRLWLARRLAELSRAYASAGQNAAAKMTREESDVLLNELGIGR
jgi:tetratricopeptide (TPR) repeat protein